MNGPAYLPPGTRVLYNAPGSMGKPVKYGNIASEPCKYTGLVKVDWDDGTTTEEPFESLAKVRDPK